MDLQHVETSFEPSTASTVFGIEQGSFYETVMPEHLEAMWGPVPLEKLPEGKENICNAVSHK